MHSHQHFPVRGSNHKTRKAPIPRPWLTDSKSKETDLDILGEPRWEFSISKLSTCCFGKKTAEARNSLHTPFRLIRRNSSCSFPSYELNSSDGSESMSDFTDSDATSVSMSLAGDKNQKQTPESPPSATTGRPPIIGTRSKSVGLPPLNPNSSLGNSPIATPRNRCDTAEFTKASNTSSTSRHRRLEQFEFSQQSLSSIWSHEPHNPRPTTTPPAEVHFPDGDDYLQFGNSSFASSFDDASGFEAWSVGHDPPIGPSVHISDLRPVIDEAKKNPAARPPRPDRPRRTKGGRKKKLKPEMSMPMYLRKRASLDEKVTGNLVISGWVAASLYDDALDERLAEPSSKMTLGDMFYMQIMEATTTAYIDLYDPSGILAHHLVLKKDWGCSSREVTSRIGKMVFIQSPILSIVRLLPISLEDAFFNGENLISSKEFSRAQSMLFVSGAGKVYAPDEQHDAATFILFTLDALVKQFGI